MKHNIWRWLSLTNNYKCQFTKQILHYVFQWAELIDEHFYFLGIIDVSFINIFSNELLLRKILAGSVNSKLCLIQLVLKFSFEFYRFTDICIFLKKWNVDLAAFCTDHRVHRVLHFIQSCMHFSRSLASNIVFVDSTYIIITILWICPGYKFD